MREPFEKLCLDSGDRNIHHLHPLRVRNKAIKNEGPMNGVTSHVVGILGKEHAPDAGSIAGPVDLRADIVLRLIIHVFFE